MRLVLALALAFSIGCDSGSKQDGGTADLGGGFLVGGTVTGLIGTLVLENGGGDDLMLTADGPFSFATRLADGAAYDVTVAQQPDGQHCTVDAGQGTIAGADVSSVQIDCSASSFTIGGTVSGLAGTLVLENGGADDLTVSADGPFSFATPVAAGAAYDVTIATQPPTRICSVSSGMGTANADVTDVMVDCVPSYAVGGTLSGLSGTVVLRDNNGDDLTLTTDGVFSFARRLVDGAAYSVTVATQPIGQRCDVASGSGGIAGADVTSVAVTCQEVFTVGGTVSGMVVGTLVLRDNGGNDLVVNFPNSSFVFTTALPAHAAYAVTVANQPTGQHCTVAASSSDVGTANVTDVSVTCRLLQVRFDEIYARPATGVYGDTNGDGVRDSDNDEFVEILNGETFDVDISGWNIKSGGASLGSRFSFPAGTTLPAGERTVVFGGGTPTGRFGTALVFTAGSLSLTDVPSPTETVELDSLSAAGATVDSFSYGTTTFGGSCTTKCESQTRDSGGSFVRHTTLSGSPGILWSPGVAADHAIPKLEGAFGSPAAGSNNSGISGKLTVQFNMFMDPTGLSSIYLQKSPCPTPSPEVSLSSVTAGSDATSALLAPAGNLEWNTTYCVTSLAAVSSANHVAQGADATYLFSTVNPGPTFTIGGTVNGLVGTVFLQNENSDTLTVASPGPFTFGTPWPDTAAYQVSVSGQPTGQFCTVGSASGAVTGANVTNVDVECKFVHTVSGTVTGLAAGTLTLVDNSGNSQSVTAGGPQGFSFPAAEGDHFVITVGTPATGQRCTVSGGDAVMGTSDLSASVSCQTLNVKIDEIHYNPATGVYGDANGDGVRDASDDEFIEILNNEADLVDVSGWVLANGTHKFTFPGGTSLASGQRAVVFGGGTLVGSFGTARSFVSGSAFVLSNTGSTVTLLSAATGGITVDTVTYADTQGTCNTSCASITRSGGGFVVHAPAPGILWSPGTAPGGAIPKLSRFSTPQNGAIHVSVGQPLVAQFNMFMNPADLAGKIALFASSCAAMTNQLGVTINLGSDNSFAGVSPSPTPSPLAFGTTYCIAADATMTNAVSVPLGSTSTIEFTTRQPVSAPAGSVVISEYGGKTPASGTNDEFVELYNPTAATIDLSGWMIQRRTGGGTASCWAILPSGASIAAHGFYLVGGAGFTGTPDFNAKFSTPSPSPSPGTSITFANESVVLKSAGACTDGTAVVDSVSIGTVTDALSGLQLPAYTPVPGGTKSFERKACYNSTGDSDLSTGMFTPGGHSTDGNSEHIGASNSDLVPRATPEPQNSSSPAEIRTCP